MTISNARWAVRILGLAMLVMGLIIWTGGADGLIPIHMLVGFAFVLALWADAYVCYRAGVPASLAAGAVVLGLILPVVGLTQQQLLPGGAHVLVQVLHLALGAAAIGLGDAMARRAEATEEEAPATSA